MAETVSVPIKPQTQGGKLLNITIREKSVLYNHYMSFLKNGGLFIPSNRQYQLGEEIMINLRLMDESENLMIKTNVVWITPTQAQNNHKPGIGLHFVGENWESVRTKIETYLAGMKSDAQTLTF